MMMKIDERFPLPDVLRQNEIETLDYLIHDVEIARHLGTLIGAAKRNHDYLKYSATSKSGSKTVVRFESHFVVSNSAADSAVALGANVRATSDDTKYQEYTYYVALVKMAGDDRHVQRMFHFDYTPDNIDTRQEHPVFHLQYCGRYKPALGDLGVTHESLDAMHPKIGVPRICSFPMSLAMILHMAIREFCTPDVADSILNRREWRKVISKNERLLLTSFLANCSHFCDNNLSSDYTWSDFAYGQ